MTATVPNPAAVEAPAVIDQPFLMSLGFLPSADGWVRSGRGGVKVRAVPIGGGRWVVGLDTVERRRVLEVIAEVTCPRPHRRG